MEGDKNTRFFHSSTLNRRRRNRITSLQDQGIWIHDQEKIKGAIVSFYTSLFRTDHLSAQIRCQSNPSNSGSISTSNHPTLDFIPSLVELKVVFFSFQTLKAPGPGGMHPFMYQKSQNTLALLLLDFSTTTFSQGTMDSKVNSTFLYLILNVEMSSLLKTLELLSSVTPSIRSSLK